MINVVFIILASCKNNSNPVQPVNPNMVLVDTTGLSKSNYLTDIAKSNLPDKNKIANPVINPAAKGKTTNTGTTVNGNNNLPSINKGTTTTTSTTTTPATIPADHGWSDAAKGTAIGVGTGVVIGTIVSKNKANGAIIGGILGGGTGYVIGRSRDRKSGRVGRHRARKRAKAIVK